VALLYAADDLCFYYRIPRNRETLGRVEVHRYYALHKSRTKTNFVFAEPENQVCVRALFPHSGHPPCWYLSRHSEQRIDFE
jgi:hypothetical protein